MGSNDSYNAMSYSISMRFDMVDLKINGENNNKKRIKRHTIPSFLLTSPLEFQQKGVQIFDTASEERGEKIKKPNGRNLAKFNFKKIICDMTVSIFIFTNE